MFNYFQMTEQVRIVSFYEFKDMSTLSGDLEQIKAALIQTMIEEDVRGTILLADEGYNAALCGQHDKVDAFIAKIEKILNTKISPKSSYDDAAPFRKLDVRIKPEIVSLRRGNVDISSGEGTHVKPKDWNDVISRPNTFILDTRNDYEFRTGTFKNAVNPGTIKFSDLPEYVEQNLDPEKHENIAMFCTGGIRCEKFAPYMKSLGFKNVFQLEGGILKYLEDVPVEEQLWDGECYVFDTRITVNNRLEKGTIEDFSLIPAED